MASLVSAKVDIPSYQQLQQQRRERHRLERLKLLEGTDSNNNTPAPSPPPIVLPEDDSIQVAIALVACNICKRNFSEDRIKVHQKICKKIQASKKERKPYDGSEHRRGPQLEVYLKAMRGEIVSPRSEESNLGVISASSKNNTPRFTAAKTKNQETWTDIIDQPNAADDVDNTKKKEETKPVSPKCSPRPQIIENKNPVVETKQDFLSANANQTKLNESHPRDIIQKDRTSTSSENDKTPREECPVHSILLRAKSAVNPTLRGPKAVDAYALLQSRRISTPFKVNGSLPEKTRSNVSVQRKLPPISFKNGRILQTRPKSEQDSSDKSKISQTRKQGTLSSVTTKDNKSPLKVQQNNQLPVGDSKKVPLSKQGNVQLSIASRRDNKIHQKAQINEKQECSKGDKLLMLKTQNALAIVNNSRNKVPLVRQRSDQTSGIPRTIKAPLPRYPSEHTSVTSAGAKATKLPTLKRRQSDQALVMSKMKTPVPRIRSEQTPPISRITKPSLLSQRVEQISVISRCNRALPAKDQSKKSFVSSRRTNLPKKKDDEFTLALRAATKYEEFIQAIRAAKQVRAQFKQATSNPSSPLEKPKHILCPHCRIDFIEAAAKHHIGKCAYMVENPQKPTLPKKIAWR